MVDFTQYPVFVADQVLTADHLNEIVNYLDEQQRLTRNKLIGIGIVCGLEVKTGTSQIQITKGCGITSEGYLIVQNDQVLTHYHPYVLPPDFYPAYKPVYQPWHMWELVTAEKSLELDDEEALNSEFLKDKIVVLLLEMKEIPLKNCIDTDCDDKGNKIEFVVRPLFVNRSDIDAFIRATTQNIPAQKSLAPEIQLKRYNVPATPLNNADAVLNGFLKLVDEPVLQQLSEALNYSYNNYKHLLTAETVNPFVNVLSIFRNILNEIKSKNPYFIQYYYDWIDDIIKAYDEFTDRVWYANMMCCPEENLFPLHLMLGEADRSTSIDFTSSYRHYFIYSPLFSTQKEVLTEIQFLFRRLKLMVENYQIKNAGEFTKTQTKITPGKYLDEPLSQRCIPYYYNPLGLYQCWSWDKTKKGAARNNLSYNANLYSTSDAVINPLNYDIEKFTFFRVEGHVGKNYETALKDIIAKRDSFNLPFDVVAVSTSALALPDVDSGTCEFQDLQAMYEVLVAELLCKIGGPVEFIGDLDVEKAPDKTTGTVVFKPKKTPVPPAPIITKAAKMESNAGKAATGAKTATAFANVGYLKYEAVKRPAYQKGEIFTGKTENVNKIGSIYTANWIKDNALDAIKLVGQQSSYLLIFINTAEDLFQALPPLLSDFNLQLFLKYYRLLVSQLPDVKDSLLKSYQAAAAEKTNTEFTEDYASYFYQFQNMGALCFDKQFAALAKEFEERVAKLKLAKNIAAYFKSHYGYEHKAGVPKGGTFILVYHENRRNDNLQTPGILTLDKSQLQAAADVAPKATMAAVKNEATVTEKISTISTVNSASLQTNSAFLKVLKDNFMLSDDKINDIINVINPALPAASSAFDLEDESIIADFYLPYLCSSNCAPIVYVCSQEEKVVFDIQPKIFLFDDAHNYPFTAEPPVTQANKEQNPFESAQLINPGKLKLWADAKNILYLHPAMSELPQTLHTTLTYQNKIVPLTIIKPDATFTISTIQNATGQRLVQLEAKNKDATKYEWKVNGKSDIFQNIATPEAISVNDLKDKTDNQRELVIELTVTYIINDVTSADTKRQRLSLVVCVDFEAPLVPETNFGQPANQQPGDVAFTTTEGIIVKVGEYLSVTGEKFFNFATVLKEPGALGSGQSIRLNSISLQFDFTKIGFKPSQVDFQFSDAGGTENLSVNGSQMFIGEITQAPPLIGNVNVAVKIFENRGTVTFRGEVTQLIIGGQEFNLDDVCAYL